MELLPADVDQRSGFCSSSGVFYSKRSPVWTPENNDSLDLHTFLFARQFGDKVALIDALTGRSLTYRELERDVRSLAAGLFKVVGVRKHHVVVLLSSNSIEFPVLFLAVVWLGAVVTTLNPMNTANELLKQMDDAGAKYIITTAELLKKVASAHLPTVIVGSTATEPRCSSNTTYCYSDLLKTEPATVSRPQSNQINTVVILYSSGTTGATKAVALTHRNYISAVCAYNSCVDENLKSILIALPMFHAYGFSISVLCSLARGIPVVVLERFEIVATLTAIQKYHVTHMSSVPPMVRAFANLDEVHKFDLRSWVQISCAGAPLGLETLAAFAERFPNLRFNQEYGMTETTGCVTTLPDGEDDHIGSSGILLPFWEAMVVDLVTKQPVSLTKQGELWIRGPAIMKEYINNPKATEESVDKNGWLHTGDLVNFDEDGYLYIVDRLKELIKYNGYQVAPAELEDLLSAHPGILDCAVIPYSDKQSGQVPMACIVRRRGHNMIADHIMQWVAQQVAPYKKVRKVAFIDTIPKSAPGKILRKELVNLVTSKSDH